MKKPGEARDAVDRVFQFARPEMRAVAEDAALGVIAAFDQLQSFTAREHFIASVGEAAQIGPRDETRARIGRDQLREGADAIAGDGGEDFLRDAEDVTAFRARETVVENADLVRAGRVALHDDRRLDLLEIIERIGHGADQFHAVAALAEIGFEDERERNRMLAASAVEREQAIGGGVAFDRIGVGDESGMRAPELRREWRISIRRSGRRWGCRDWPRSAE